MVGPALLSICVTLSLNDLASGRSGADPGIGRMTVWWRRSKRSPGGRAREGPGTPEAEPRSLYFVAKRQNSVATNHMQAAM